IAQADNARQAHCGAVAHWHAPAARIDAEASAALGDADIAEQRYAQTAGAGGTGNSADHRLAERRAQRAMLAAGPGEVVGAVGQRLEIGAGAKRTTGAGQHRAA